MDYEYDPDAEKYCFDDQIGLTEASKFMGFRYLVNNNLVKLAIDEIKKRGRQTVLSSHISF